jgi:PTH1 family peptidyl-tRNA hydrolase
MAKKIIVGLGNPGVEYEITYHNVGLLALQAFAPKGVWKKHANLFTYLATQDAVFIHPLTYMNESGKAVRAAIKKYNANAEELVVLHDESDLMTGDYKISVARNAAGHKGIQSIIDLLGTNAFTRIRIGIRSPREVIRKKAGDFALKPIAIADRKTFARVFTEILATHPELIGK